MRHSPVLLYISPQGASYWRRRPDSAARHPGAANSPDAADATHHWQACSGPLSPTEPIWLLTDIAAETLLEVSTPPLRGRDLRDLHARLLDQHFLHTQWRTSWRPRRAAAANSCLLFAIDPASELENALPQPAQANEDVAGAAKASNVSKDAVEIAGISSTTLLLAELALESGMPAELFVILPLDYGTRIVFMRQGRPLLTRLTQGGDAQTATTLLEEIKRTQRHLNNTLLQAEANVDADADNNSTAKASDQHPPHIPGNILLLAQTDALATTLRAAGYTLLPAPACWRQLSQNNAATQQASFALFDLAWQQTRRPSASHRQLLPPAYRAHQRLTHLRRKLLLAGALIMLGASALFALQLTQYQQLQQQLQQQQTALQQLQQQLTPSHDTQHTDLSVPLLQQAVHIHRHALESRAPSMFAQQLQQLAQALAQATPPTFRLHTLSWRLLDAGQAACAQAPHQQNEKDGTHQPQAELKFSAQLELAAHEQTPPSLSNQLRQLPAATLLLDPQREQPGQVLQGGSQLPAQRTLAQWCLSMSTAQS